MSSQRDPQGILSSTARGLLSVILLGSMVVSVACGGGGSGSPVPQPTPIGTPAPSPTPAGSPSPSPSPTPTSSPSPTPTPVAGPPTTTQLRLGDAPADRVISFEVSLGPGPLVVTLSTGQSFNVAVQNNRWELAHLAANLQPLTVQAFPQGAISRIQIPLSNPEATYFDDLGMLHTFPATPAQPVIVDIDLSSHPLTIGSSPAIVTVDINVASTLTFDSGGNVTGINFSPSTFTFATKQIGSNGAVQQDDTGEIDGVTGVVSLVTGNSFELDSGQDGASITFVTDSTTRFDGGTLATLLKKIVKVEGYTRMDGSVFASAIETLEDSASGSELEGVLIGEDGWPLSSNRPEIEVLAQDGIGNGMDPAKVGQPFWVDITGFSNFTVDWGRIVNLGWSFDGRDISPAQRVQVELPAGVPAPSTPDTRNYTAVPSEIKLLPQSITGQVSNFNATTGEFDLNLAVDSYINVLTKITSVHVYLKPETDMRLNTIKNGDKIRVRGLLFFTLTANIPDLGPKPWGYFRMIARRVTAP